MKRRAVLIAVFSVLAALVLFAVISIVTRPPARDKADYRYDEELSLHNGEIKYRLLKDLGYTVNYRMMEYNRTNVDCIFLEGPLDKKAEARLSNWLSGGRRLIAYLSPENFYEESFEDYYDYLAGKTNYEFSYRNLPVRQPDPLMEGVTNLYINTEYALPRKVLLFGKRLSVQPLFTHNGQVFIGRAAHREGEIILIGDANLFSDFSVLKEGNALFLNGLLRKYYRKNIVFDNVIRENAPKKPFFLFTSQFPLVLFQLALIVASYFLVFYKRFGPPLDAGKYRRRSLAQHIRLSGLFFEKARGERTIVSILDDYFFERLHALAGARGDGNLEGVRRRYSSRVRDNRIFERGLWQHILEIEKERESFLKILEKGEDNGKKNQKDAR